MIRDSGMKKWYGFMMPENVKATRQMFSEDNKQPRPTLNEEQIEEMERLLQESLTQGSFVEITTWKDGYFTKRVCKVKKVNPIEKNIVIEDEFNSKFKVGFFNITSVIAISNGNSH
ncbi:YolD-like family protein [Neobacillus cucumis]|uniref:YolD-like family protein n=1 Tax=Neobacillus cucumis TaxID=1740721 RepID=UPI0019649892|nr:YolD-like family protein [Neobacillus cucumis]MBM7651772.1 hypothetical protein [Neobacillus cucumis]